MSDPTLSGLDGGGGTHEVGGPTDAVCPIGARA